MVAAELGHIKEVVRHGILLCEVRAVANLGAVVVVQRLLVVVGLRAALVTLLTENVLLQEHIVGGG